MSEFATKVDATLDGLIAEMRMALDEIVRDNGYQEMADGFNQALQIVEQFHSSHSQEPTREPAN